MHDPSNDINGEEFIEVPPKKRRCCPHCLEYVGYSTYYRHRDRFFDVATNQWDLAPTGAKLTNSTPNGSTSTSPAEQVEESASVSEVGDTTVYNDSYSAYCSRGSEEGTNEGVFTMHCKFDAL